MSLYRASIVLKLEKCAKFNMDSFPLKLCRLHVMEKKTFIAQAMPQFK